MKKIVCMVLVALAVSVNGCKSQKIQVIHTNDPAVTNNVQRVSGGFNDETYIWEGWTFSTNRVVK